MNNQLKELRDFGWMNGWAEVPSLIKKCQEEGHSISDIDVGPYSMGMHHIVECKECGYRYHYDSSD